MLVRWCACCWELRGVARSMSSFCAAKSRWRTGGRDPLEHISALRSSTEGASLETPTACAGSCTNSPSIRKMFIMAARRVCQCVIRVRGLDNGRVRNSVLLFCAVLLSRNDTFRTDQLQGVGLRADPCMPSLPLPAPNVTPAARSRRVIYAHRTQTSKTPQHCRGALRF
jgi:hypothetical protein